MKHKWYDVIVAWAEGEEVEVLDKGVWRTDHDPAWFDEYTYRVKPKSDVVPHERQDYRMI